MNTVVHIVGNRPQFIKLAVLYHELRRQTIPQRIIHTGQHFDLDMSDIFFRELVIPDPDINLSITQASADTFIGEASLHLQQQLSKIHDPVAFVYGDTNTTLAGAFAARRTNTPLIHFEGGVRTGDTSMPEEINRIVTDRLASTNYCCTRLNYNNLLAEGHAGFMHNRAIESGDLMLDAFLQIEASTDRVTLENNYVACTIHRAANILSQEKLAGIIEGLNRIHKLIPVVMPLHPHTRKRLHEFGLQVSFITLSPLGYPAMKNLLLHCDYVITDSGGAAREAYFSGKKSVVVMEKPFWPEILDAGCALNSEADANLIFEAVANLDNLRGNFQTPIFGKGDAARLIAKDLQSILS